MVRKLGRLQFIGGNGYHLLEVLDLGVLCMHEMDWVSTAQGILHNVQLNTVEKSRDVVLV